MDIFGAAHGWRGGDGGGGGRDKKSPLRKICDGYPAMMRCGTVIPYLKKIKKKI